jgi:hypothetical protein
MSFTIRVSKNDADSVTDMIKQLNNQENYFYDGRYTNFLPNIICKDCDFPCTYNPIALGMRTPIAVKCFRCNFVYFHHENQTKQ